MLFCGDVGAFNNSKQNALTTDLRTAADQMARKVRLTELETKAREAIDAMPEHPNAMPESERQQRLTDGRGSVERLERSEESLITVAAAEGIEVMRRPNADPRAVLGIATKRGRAKA